jgi:hypothetical protein
MLIYLNATLVLDSVRLQVPVLIKNVIKMIKMTFFEGYCWFADQNVLNSGLPLICWKVSNIKRKKFLGLENQWGKLRRSLWRILTESKAQWLFWVCL